jgi:hypothetical protein
MAVKLIAEFVGLMALVPGLDCGSSGGAKCNVDIAVMNGEFGHATGTDVGKHDARLVVDFDSLCTDRVDPHEDLCKKLESTAPDDFFASDYRRKAVWYLTRSKMTIKNSAGAGVRLWDKETGDDKQPGSDATRRFDGTWKDLAWLGSVYRASSQSEDKILVNPIYLDPPTKKEPWPVDAILKFTDGTVMVGKPEDEKLRDGTWDFADLEGNHPSHTRALSSHFTLAADVSAAGLVTIELEGFPGNEGRKATIHLASTDDMRITIAALPEGWASKNRARQNRDCECEEQMKGREDEEAGPGESPGAAHAGHDDGDPDSIDHFVAYYNLLMTPGADRIRIPWRTGRDQNGSRPFRQDLSPEIFFLALSSQDCPPALARRAKEPQ